MTIHVAKVFKKKKKHIKAELKQSYKTHLTCSEWGL